jgi:CRP-like cAMP-binding protein
MSQFSPHNELLRALPENELARLRASLERVRLSPGERVHEAFRPMDAALFVESGLISCFSGQGGRDQTEVALIGREGMAGLSLVLGAVGEPYHLVSQRVGEAYRLPAERLRAACRESRAFFDLVLRYGYALGVQIAETGRANARQTVEARLARWLLMAHDRIDGNEIELTHENLSQILGVRRPGITVALHVLEGEHMIRARRGTIEVIDRAQLTGAANGSYGLPEQEYARVLGPTVPARQYERAAGAALPERLSA